MDERLVDLEVKVAFLERNLVELDELVRSTLDTLLAVRSEVQRLSEAAAAAPPPGGPAHGQLGGLEDEVPPHHVRW